MKYYADAHVLEPVYMKEFACVGEACEDNCCRGNTDIDREVFKLYKALPDSQIKSKIMQSLDIYASGDSCKYAHVKTSPGESCLFLNECGLCFIHRELGPEYLSMSCYTVPKLVNRLGGLFEKSLKLFCPEACRLVLLSPDIMEFEDHISDESVRLDIKKNFSQSYTDQVQPAWFEIRSAFIDMLQDRRFDFGRRLMMAGFAADELDKLCFQGAGTSDIIAFLNNMAMDYAAEGAVADIMAIKPADDVTLGTLISHIYEKLIRPMEKSTDTGFVRYVRLAVEGLGLPAAPDEAASRYHNVRGEYLKGYIDGVHVYEQYYVNALFGRAFPLGKQNGLFEEFMIIVVYYFIMDLMITGISKAVGNIDDVIAVDFIHRFAKLMEFEPSYDKMVRPFISTEKPGGIVTLIALTV